MECSKMIGISHKRVSFISRGERGGGAATQNYLSARGGFLAFPRERKLSSQTDRSVIENSHHPRIRKHIRPVVADRIFT
jgi:hypothetical protein